MFSPVSHCDFDFVGMFVVYKGGVYTYEAIFFLLCVYMVTITTTHLQHPTWVSRRMHSGPPRGQPSVLHCV